MMNAIFFYRIGNFFYRKNMKLVSKFFDALIFLVYNSYIPSSCKIGKGTTFAYKGISVVIHSRSIIGDNCIIGQGITIGGKDGSLNPPIIGNNVYVAAGSRIIGDIEIGDNCIIGANSVVNKSFNSNSVIAGVPAKIIRNIIE
jgi:serine O-acetyltransferase